MITKKQLRKKYMEKRMALSPRELEIASESICHLFFSNFQVEDKKISLFLPIERAKEINTYIIWEKALSFDAKVAVPKVDSKSNSLKHILFESTDQLELSSYGIPEPHTGKVIASEHFDFVIVPLLTIDKKGNRVGYGKGFYDRFLNKCSPRAKFIGVSHFDELEDVIPELTKSDIPLHYCITPSKIHRFE